VYLINDDIKQLTEDHSYVAERVRDGSILPEEAKNHVMKNVLSQCIGVYEDIEIFEYSGIMAQGDSFLLCSDGFYNFMDDTKVKKTIDDLKSGVCKTNQEATELLLSDVKTRDPNDNISIIIVSKK
jgi:protein phosphatase